jgi:hypothetical protein
MRREVMRGLPTKSVEILVFVFNGDLGFGFGDGLEFGRMVRFRFDPEFRSAGPQPEHDTEDLPPTQYELLPGRIRRIRMVNRQMRFIICIDSTNNGDLLWNNYIWS